MKTSLKIFGTHEERTIQQLQRCVDAESGAIGVLCADGHVGYSMPIGGVVAYRDHVSPSGVGYDIACGNMAVETNLMAEQIPVGDWPKLADEIQARISFGVGRKNNEPVDDPVLDDIAHAQVPQQAAMAQIAAQQLGTVGSGNHYVDVLEDETGRVWVGVHFGSRGFGHKTAKGFMNIAQGRAFEDGSGEGEMDSPPLLLNVNTPCGWDYIEAMQLAGQYASAGREAVVRKVVEILKAKPEFAVHNHHNYAWRELRENPEGELNWYWVIRKGATPAESNQYGFVGGSMGDISVILRGVESEKSVAALYSTVHGAGRVMSRTQAAGKQKWHKAKWVCGNYRNCPFTAPIAMFERSPQGERPTCPACGSKLNRQGARREHLGGGLVDFETEKAVLIQKGIMLRGAGADEAPPVYRPLAGVLQAHVGTIEVIHTLMPRIVVMAGGDEFDPYKD